MTTEKVTHPARGKTWYGPRQTIDTNNYEAVHLEGHTVEFPNLNPAAKTTRLSNRPVVMRLMRNTSGITLYKGMIVTSAAGYSGKRFDGLARLTACEVAGVIDDCLGSGGVRNGDLCWVHIQGPALVLSYWANAGADVAAGNLLYATTSAASNVTTSAAGRFSAWNTALTATATQATDGTMTGVIVNHFARAQSARLTSATNTQTLVDMCLRI
jgi:hypothetical protein